MTRQKARDLCFPTKFLPKTLLRLARAVINQSLSPHNSTNHRAIAFYFGSNGQAYSNMRRRQYTSPERPYMGVPTTVTDAPGAATVINQVRHTSNGKLVLDESTRHMLPGGLAYDEHDQDDWYLGSNDPSDFGHIPKAYTPFATPSSIHPHIQLSFKPANYHQRNIIETLNLRSVYKERMKTAVTHSSHFVVPFLAQPVYATVTSALLSTSTETRFATIPLPTSIQPAHPWHQLLMATTTQHGKKVETRTPFTGTATVTPSYTTASVLATPGGSI